MYRSATTVGKLNTISDCEIEIPTKNGMQTIYLNNLPDISDSKGAVYNSEPIMGRAFPLYTYANSGPRNITMVLHFYNIDSQRGADGYTDIERNINYLRLIQSAVYPREGVGGAPYRPPPVCKIKCGYLLSGNLVKGTKPEPLCVSLESYGVKFPTEVAWEETTNMPYKFDVDTKWITVVSSEKLPFSDDISNGRIFRI